MGLPDGLVPGDGAEVTPEQCAAQRAYILSKWESGKFATYCPDCGWKADMGGWGITQCPVCTGTDCRVRKLEPGEVLE